MPRNEKTSQRVGKTASRLLRSKRGWNLGRCSKHSNYLPLPSLLIGIVNFPNGNFDNFDLRPPGRPHV